MGLHKWDEKTILAFLCAYREHPCLWNPYDAKYYNCLAKNDALKNTIKKLDIPELNVSDCLEQIKAIRIKYGEEQIRIIKGLHSQIPYVSPFAWVPIITGMLAQVINDEEKLQNGVKPKTKTILRDKSVRTSNFPCAYGEVQEYNLERRQIQDDFKMTPRRNTKFTKTGHMLRSLDKSDEKSKETDSGRLDMPLCPSCGWENTKPDKLNIIRRKAYELIQSDSAVPCPECTNVMGKLYEGFNPVVNDRTGCNNTVPCPNFLHGWPIHTVYSANIPIRRTCQAQNTRNIIANQQARQPIPATKPKFCTRGIQLLDEQSFPERRTRRVGIGVEHCKRKIQSGICVSGTNVTLPIYKCAIVQTSNRGGTDTVRRCRKGVESRPWILRKELKQAATNTVEQRDEEIQSMVCVSRMNSSVSQTSERHPSTRRESKQIASAVRCPSKGVIGINLNSAECFVPKCVLVTAGVKSTSSERPEPREITKLVSAIESKSPSRSPCLEEKEKNNATAVYVKTFLEIMRHVLALDNKKCIANVQEGTERAGEKDSTEAFTILSEMKKCADRISKIYTTDCPKKQSSNEFCPRYKSRCLTKTDAASSSTGLLENDYDPSGNYVASVETAMEKRASAGSKEIATHAETRRDVGFSVLLPRISLRDAETQYIPKQLRDTGVVSERERSFEQRISVDTQKREPTLFRAIRCSNSERILKCDRETRVRDARVIRPRGMVSKHLDENERKHSALRHLTENAYRKYIVGKHYNEVSIPAVSYAREKEINLIDCHMSSLSNKNYKCDENCRDALSYDPNWGRINNFIFGLSSNRRISRIPLYVKPHKYTHRTNTRGISRSYI